MMEPRKAVESVVRYLSSHPEEISRFVRGGLGMRVGVPLAAFRWILSEVSKDAGLDADIDVEPPGLRLAATVERMATRMRIHASLFVQDIEIDDRQIRVEMRIENLSIDVLSAEKTQLSALIRSGALDLSRPGDLVDELPDLPPVVVFAQGNRIAVDLMKAERFENPRLKEIVGVLSALVTVKDVRSEKSEHVDVSLRALPRGPRTATRALRNAVLEPGISQARKLTGRLLRRAGGRRLLGGGSEPESPPRRF